jgi:hypothetical protein
LLWLPVPDASSGGTPSKQHHRAQQTQAYRFPLYSEGKRETLAAELLASTKGRPAAKLITRLDDYCIQHDGQRLPDDYHDGPFGVFDIRHASTVAAERSTDDDDDDETIPVSSQGVATVEPTASTNFEEVDRTVDLDALISSLEDTPSNESVEEIGNVHQGDSPLETALVRGSSESDFWQLDGPFSFMNDLDMHLDLSTGDYMGTNFSDSTFSTFHTEGFAGLLDNNRVARRSPTPPPRIYAQLLAEAPILLRYYQSEGNASRPAKQSFWGSFVLPSALRTFGELTVFGKASDLSSSIFYSTIANSAFAMQSSDSALPDDSRWHNIGETAESAARHCLQSALQSPQPDCRELLTATLSLALVSVGQ